MGFILIQISKEEFQAEKLEIVSERQSRIFKTFRGRISARKFQRKESYEIELLSTHK